MATVAQGISNEFYDMYLSIQFELRKHFRRRRLFIIVSLAVVMPLVFNVFPAIRPVSFANNADTFTAAVAQFVGILIIISGALFAGDAVSSEFEKKTGLLLFPTTQSRTAIFTGKYFAALLATFLVVAVYYAVTVAEVGVTYGASQIPLETARSFSLALLYSVSVVSIIFFFSSIMQRTISSTITGLVVLLLVLPIVDAVLTLVNIEPWFVVTYSAGLITNVLETGPVFGGPGGESPLTTFTPELNRGIAIMASYGVVFGVSGVLAADSRSVE